MDMAKPIIRFKGYQDDWEQRKVSELCSISTGKSNTQDKVEDGEYPFYVRSPIIERSTKYLYDEEAVITVGDGVGTGKVFHYVNGKYDLHQRCYRMYGFSDELNAHYFYHTFSKLFYKRVMAMTAKTSVDSVRLEMISDMKIPVPNVEEQRKIGNLLDGIDNLITLHQRKCDETKRLKKYMLQKMFPQNGEKVPEIRFSGFTDDWEQRKLGDVAPLRGGYAFKSSEYKKDGTPIVRISNILPDGSIGADFACYDDMENDENISLRNGDALLAMSGATTGKVSILKCKNTDKYYQNQRVGYFKRNIQYNYDFVSTIVRSDLFKEQLMSVLVAGAQPNVSSKEIDSFEFVFPLNIEEQKKIGQYFANLDTLITLHQRELENLQNIKKFMLGKMFV